MLCSPSCAAEESALGAVPWLAAQRRISALFAAKGQLQHLYKSHPFDCQWLSLFTACSELLSGSGFVLFFKSWTIGVGEMLAEQLRALAAFAEDQI